MSYKAEIGKKPLINFPLVTGKALYPQYPIQLLQYQWASNYQDRIKSKIIVKNTNDTSVKGKYSPKSTCMKC